MGGAEKTYVIRYIGRRIVHNVVGHTRQRIPNTRTTTFVLCSAFDLESCTSNSPPEEVSESVTFNIAFETYQKSSGNDQDSFFATRGTCWPVGNGL
jgi:hypothetical protein